MTTRTILTPASITATATGPGIDISGLSGQARISLVALNTAGTNPTLACKLQSATSPTRGYEQAVEGATSNKLLSASTTANALAATFTQAGARSVKRVALMLKQNGTLAAGKKLTAKIKADDGGDPAATLGTSATVDIDTEVGEEYAWVVFTFATPVDLADDTAYHIELTGNYDADTTNNVTWRSATVADSGNYVQLDDSTWTATATKDLEARVDEYTFTDITGGGFTTLITASNNTVESIDLHARSLPQFIRAHSTVGGTSNPAFTAAIIVNAARVQEQ